MPDLTATISKIRATTDLLTSIILWINESAARQQAAVDAAVALGASPEQVAQMQAEVDAQTAKAADAAAAMIANTPAAG